jgi:hypothetical protein
MLPVSTIEYVKSECDIFDREEKLVEDALSQLRTQFPRNTEPSEVLLKVLVLNKLYSTRVRDIDVETLSLHIANLSIDPLLEEGSPEAVEMIAKCDGLKRYYSFATKFCCWHNRAAYPIHDGNVVAALCAYQAQDHFWDFRWQDLQTYGKLIETVTAFRVYDGLETLDFKNIDKYLWREGDRIIKAAQ